MLHRTRSLTSRGGLTLHAQSWRPQRNVRANVAVVHGFVEHSGRYTRLAADLAEHAYAVHALDLRGHGRSAGEACYVRRFEDYLDDVEVLLASVVEEADGRPTFLFGHSMGGAVAALYTIQRQPPLAGLVLSSPALRVGQAVFPWLRRLVPVVGCLFPRWRVVRMGGRNVSRDPAVVADFRADPLVFHERFPLGTAAEIFRAMRIIRRRGHELRLPLLVLHGTGDVVCDCAASEALVRRAASADKTLHLYPGLFHELRSEPESPQVFADLLAWLNARC
jgi:acylglycerol lipase